MGLEGSSSRLEPVFSDGGVQYSFENDKIYDKCYKFHRQLNSSKI